MDQLKDRVLRLRRATGLTQQQMAELLKVSQQAYDAVEQGKTKRPHFLGDLANLTGVAYQALKDGPLTIPPVVKLRISTSVAFGLSIPLEQVDRSFSAVPNSPDEQRWILEGLQQPGKTMEGLARLLSLQPDEISRVISGDRLLKPHEVPIARTYLAPLHSGNTPDLPPTVPADFVSIPVYDVTANAGDGGFDQLDLVETHDYFRASFLRGLTTQPPSMLVLAYVQGDSMQESLHHGDQTLVLRGNKFTRDGIYWLDMGSGLQVKRVALDPRNKTFTVISDNKAYPTWPDVSEDNVRFVGRVVWVGKRV